MFSVDHHIRWADKAADKADASAAKIPKKKKLVKYREADPATGKARFYLKFEDVDKPVPAAKLFHAVKTAPVHAAAGVVHRKIGETEQDNVGMESAHKLEQSAEGGVHLAAHSRRVQKLKPYEYSICNVTLTNFDLSHLPVYVLDEDEMHLYAVYMATLGSRPDLFPSSEYPNASQRGDYLDYDVPRSALEDETFAAMLKEAEKYLG